MMSEPLPVKNGLTVTHASSRLMSGLIVVLFSETVLFQNRFYNSLTCKGETSAPATDTVPSAGLAQDYRTLVACQAPSGETTPDFPLVPHLMEHIYMKS